MKPHSHNSARMLLQVVLALVLLAACASPAPSVTALPPEPKPVATASMMRTLPEPSSFRNRLIEIFNPKPTGQTK